MEQKPSGVAWIALIISILSLILAWVAFNRAGEDLEEMVADQVEEAMVEVRQEYEEAEDAALEGTADTLEVGADALDETADSLEEGANETDEAAGEVRSAQ